VIPFNVNVGGQKVGITFESLIWFFVATAAATVFGEIVYYYVQSYLPTLPSTNNTVTTKAIKGAPSK
jgi:hypothetical protein